MVVVISDSISEVLVRIVFNPVGYRQYYPVNSFVKTTNYNKYGKLTTNKISTNVLLVPGLVHVWWTCFWNVVWSVWRLVHVLDFVDWSSYLHALNGNIQQYQRFSDIVFQNIPGLKSQVDVQVCLDLLLSMYRPLVLGLGEVDHEKLELCHFPGYMLIKGRQSIQNNKMRINLLIKEHVEFEELDLGLAPDHQNSALVCI